MVTLAPNLQEKCKWTARQPIELFGVRRRFRK
jgi:hypothetical protein